MIIYNQRLAGYLMMNGFVLQGIEKDKRNPKYNIFHFKETDKLKILMKQYKNNKNK